MEHIKTFLDTSTIHGLSWISSSTRWPRLFWTLVVIGGFTGAGYIIYTSWYNWEQSPIKTTTETLPISELKFPNITVCPAKRPYLHLNEDFKDSEKINVPLNIRKELVDYAIETIQDAFFNETMKNLSKVEEIDRYYNWYNGYTDIRYPYMDKSHNRLVYNIHTEAMSGNVSIQNLGNKFDSDKVDGNIKIDVQVTAPDSVRHDDSVTLMFSLDKLSIKDFGKKEEMIFELIPIDADLTHFHKNYTDKSTRFSLILTRKLSKEDISNIELDTMPGFRLTWNYDQLVGPGLNEYSSFSNTKNFVRYLLVTFLFWVSML